VKEYYKQIKKRFEQNKNICVFPFGMADSDCEMSIGIEGDKSSLYKKSKNNEIIRLKNFKEFFVNQQMEYIDLIKINIEGAEYDLLEHIINEGMIGFIGNLQIQFHSFVEDAEVRMKNIKKKLSQTHKLTWQYPFVWENWELK